MKLERLVGWALAVYGMELPGAAGQETVRWERDLGEATQLAKESERPLLIVFR